MNQYSIVFDVPHGLLRATHYHNVPCHHCSDHSPLWEYWGPSNQWYLVKINSDCQLDWIENTQRISKTHPWVCFWWRGSDWVIGLILWWFWVWRDYWEVVNGRKCGFGGGNRSQRPWPYDSISFSPRSKEQHTPPHTPTTMTFHSSTQHQAMDWTLWIHAPK